MSALSAIWHVRGQLPLRTGQSAEAALAALDPLFHAAGTQAQRAGAELRFTKTSPLAQDAMAVFERGHLTVGADGALHYELESRALLACFFAPLLFAAFALTLDSAKIAGWVFAGIFVALYALGRWWEHRQVHALLRKTLDEAVQPVVLTA